MTAQTCIANTPIFASDRTALTPRTFFSFRDYGFEVDARVTELFDIVPSMLSDEECFLFFFSRDDVRCGRWALFNLHVFLKRTGTIENFARSLGKSMRDIPLVSATPFGLAGLGYSRTIAISELFEGAEQVITLIGAEPSAIVRDSHEYFAHHHAHGYTGVLHPPGDEMTTHYDNLRRVLFTGVRFMP